LLIERAHVIHLGGPFFISQLGHCLIMRILFVPFRILPHLLPKRNLRLKTKIQCKCRRIGISGGDTSRPNGNELLMSLEVVVRGSTPI
jgi:hypothetical protein